MSRKIYREGKTKRCVNIGAALHGDADLEISVNDGAWQATGIRHLQGPMQITRRKCGQFVKNGMPILHEFVFLRPGNEHVGIFGGRDQIVRWHLIEPEAKA